MTDLNGITNKATGLSRGDRVYVIINGVDADLVIERLNGIEIGDTDPRAGSFTTLTAGSAKIVAPTPVFEINGTVTNNTAELRFTSGGAVDSRITHVGNTGILTLDSGRDASWNGKIAFVTDTVERCRIDSSGLRPAVDNAVDLGASSHRWDDIYAANGTIQTSDGNEKQDIEALSDAERRAAVAAKNLLRKFRWIDAVEAKGDNARMHFGIIAQDLQDAFEAEGLDAGRYAMFVRTTSWEHDVEVPAVEAVAAVLDGGGNVIEPAVEAADAYTRTDTYKTQEEAPAGATEHTRLGVRYSELLAFIISAI